jgi:hypothetical protein
MANCDSVINSTLGIICVPVLGEELGQLSLVDSPLVFRRVIRSFHGGSPFTRFGNPILSGQNSRSTYYFRAIAKAVIK